MGFGERSAIHGCRPTVRLYQRPECHLCEEAMAELEELRADGLRFEVQRVDIESDDALLRRYVERIPVIELGGEEVSALGLDADELRRRLATVSP